MAKLWTWIPAIIATCKFYLVKGNESIVDYYNGRPLRITLTDHHITAYTADDGKVAFTTSDLRTEMFYGQEVYKVDCTEDELKKLDFWTLNNHYELISAPLESIQQKPAKAGYSLFYKVVWVDETQERPWNVGDHFTDPKEASFRKMFLESEGVEVKGVFPVYLNSEWVREVDEYGAHLPDGEFNFNGRRNYRKSGRERFCPESLKAHDKREYFNRLDYYKEMV